MTYVCKYIGVVHEWEVSGDCDVGGVVLIEWTFSSSILRSSPTHACSVGPASSLLVQFEEGELYERFKAFYDDVLPEFQRIGTVVQFKVCVCVRCVACGCASVQRVFKCVCVCWHRPVHVAECGVCVHAPRHPTHTSLLLPGVLQPRASPQRECLCPV